MKTDDKQPDPPNTEELQRFAEQKRQRIRALLERGRETYPADGFLATLLMGAVLHRYVWNPPTRWQRFKTWMRRLWNGWSRG